MGGKLSITELPAKIADKIEHEPNSDCWLWTGAISGGNYKYAISVIGRRNFQTRNLIWQQFIGPIESGLILDHLCRTPACVNPAHQEPVTYRENMERALHANGFSIQTHCRAGHEYAITGMRMVYAKVGPQRRCLACDARRSREYRARLKS